MPPDGSTRCPAYDHSLQSVPLVPVGGAAKAVAVQLSERGVAASIDLADASDGTVRLLALLAARMNRTAYVDGDRGNRSRPAPLRDGRSA